MRISIRPRSVFLSISLACLSIAPLSAQVVRQLTDVKQDGLQAPAIDDAGTVVLALSGEDLGGNPQHALQVVKWELPGPVRTQITTFDKGGALSLSVSDDGQQVAVISPSSPTGQNHDGSLELFTLAIDGSGVTQLTSDPGPVAGQVTAAMLAGSGNRIAFASTSNPLGTNPGGVPQLFVIDADGTDLAQLTSATSGELAGVSISDDGERIAFVHSADLTGGNPSAWSQVFKILADGTGLTQMTSFAGNAGEVQIAGNGGSVVYRDLGSGSIFLQEWVSAVGTSLVAGTAPSITDNGKFIYYYTFAGGGVDVYYIRNSGGASTLVTTAAGPNHFNPVVSGAGLKVAFSISEGAYPGGTNPDGGVELVVADASGANGQQLTENGPEAFDYEVDMTPDGTRIAFGSTNNLTGANLDGSTEIFVIESDGSGLVQLTPNAEAYHPEISDDGQRITFFSFDDLTGDNPAPTGQIFSVLADGSGLTQLTPGSSFLNDHPTLAGDGSVVVFQGLDNFTGGNPDISPELFAIPFGGGPIVQVTSDDDSLHKNPQVDGTGTWVAFHSASNFDGANPSGATQVLRARVDGTLVQRITTDPDHGAFRPDISADGNRVVFVGTLDPLGTNADHSSELFVWDATSGFIQLTFTASGGHNEPRISDDGQVVYFLSDEPFFEPTPSGQPTPYRVDVATATISRPSGMADPRDLYFATGLRNSPMLAVDADGSRFAFAGTANPVGTNLDFSTTLFLADYDLPAHIEPGRGVPTVVNWDVEPKPVRYDLIRGDVANLADGGATVDLGPVVCIEDGSPDTTSAGFGDVDQPVSGQAFFYVYRGTQGLADGAGSYGQGTGALERLPASGDCAL